MRNRFDTWRLYWLLAVGLLGVASAAAAQPCCECRCPRNEARACSAAFGLDDKAYLEAVCKPLGCSIAVCTDRACRQSNRCPREETGFCADGFDNDADGKFDCDDADCKEDDACTGNVTPTTPSGGTPGASPTATRTGSPATPPPGTSMTATATGTRPTSTQQATPTTTPTPPPPTVTPTVTLTPETKCCIGHDFAPGCEVRNCQTCVCRRDDFCCDAVWDANCAILAATECQPLCRCPDLPTPTVTPTATRTGTPHVASDCCFGRPEEEGGGCSVPPCERCVCDVDDFCCHEFWDGSCGDIANDECTEICACDSAPSGPTPTPPRTSTPANPGTPGTPHPSSTPGIVGSRTATRAPNATQTRRACTTNDDCLPGQTCNSAGRCIGVPQTPSGGGGGGSCTLPPTGAAPSTWLWLIVPAALWALRRRGAIRTQGWR